jgi:ribose transport system substrate-binding protein
MRMLGNVMCVLAVACMIAGCGSKPAGQKPTVTVALVMKSQANPFFQTMEKGAAEEAKRLDVKLLPQYLPNEQDIEKQADVVRSMAAQKVDVILIAPVDGKALVGPLLEAQKQGVKIINIDNPLDAETVKAQGLRVECYVGVDNVEGAHMAGEYLIKLMGGKGNVAMLEGIRGVDNAEARKRGFLNACEAHKDGIKIVASETAKWEREEAHTAMQTILQRDKDIQGLFCANDMMALGAVEAIKQAGLEGKMLVSSYDNIAEARAAIKEGRLQATIDQHPELMGKFGVQYAADLAAGKQIPTQKLVQLDLVTKQTLTK